MRIASVSTITIAALGVLAGGCAESKPAPGGAVASRSLLYVFTGVAHDSSHAAAAGDSSATHAASDFLAVIDADSASGTYATIIATIPIGVAGTMPHHTEMAMPPNGEALFANSFMSGKTYRFDFSDPLAPKVAGVIDTVPGLHYPHSFVRLANGDRIGTYQFGDGSRKGDPGGIARISATGKLLASRSAFDPAYPDSIMRTYSLDVSEATDRIVTTTTPMDPKGTSSDIVQLWRLSDLTLLKSIPLPPPRSASDSSTRYPFEVRFFPDGKSAILNTYYCGFYLLTGLDGEAPAIESIGKLDKGEQQYCAVPLLIGKWWILPVELAKAIHVYDVSDPRRPKLAGKLETDSTFYPHWLSREPGGNRIVVTTEWKAPGVRLARFDSTTGSLTWDESFRETAGGPLGISFDRDTWPHGKGGKGLPHGTVFSRR